MAMNDRRGVTTMTHRRNFLTGIASLIVAPAVVRAEALMPIVVWRPTFWHTRNVGMGPFLSCRADELIGIDLRSLGLPKPVTFSGSPGQLFWSYWLHPLESLPQNRIRIAPWSAKRCACSSTNHPIGGLALAATRASPQPERIRPPCRGIDGAGLRAERAHPRHTVNHRLGPPYVDSSRPVCAKSGHSATAWRMGQIDPIAKSLERVPNWRSRSKAFTVAASV
jgi:hypothetical protein